MTDSTMPLDEVVKLVEDTEKRAYENKRYLLQMGGDFGLQVLKALGMEGQRVVNIDIHIPVSGLVMVEVTKLGEGRELETAILRLLAEVKPDA